MEKRPLPLPLAEGRGHAGYRAERKQQRVQNQLPAIEDLRGFDGVINVGDHRNAPLSGIKHNRPGESDWGASLVRTV